MPRGPAPQWTQRKPPFTYEHIQSSVAGGLDPQTGHYAELVYGGCESEDRAREIKRSLYRCAKHLGFSMWAEVEAGAGDEYQVRFRAIDKTAARAYVRKRYGQQMPYNPYARNTPESE